MRLLLDTKVWLWWVSDHPDLGERARQAIGDAGNEVFLSAASIWEIITKCDRTVGFAGTPLKQIQRWIESDGFPVLPIEYGTVLEVLRRQMHQTDPFDQLLVAQAITRGLVVVTDDRYPFERYDVDVIVTCDQGSR